MTVAKARIWASATVALALTALVGCSSAPEAPVDGGYGGLSEHAITLKDGRTITCVVFQEYSKGGVSCDWEVSR